MFERVKIALVIGLLSVSCAILAAGAAEKAASKPQASNTSLRMERCQWLLEKSKRKHDHYLKENPPNWDAYNRAVYNDMKAANCAN
ncbi:hypothetical protein [Caballeronia sp. ATUFL_F1_KS4A]|uniref:hypothetical protein n=1 Tax=Caballeronia sp. ATUFL_F1_KS4A TaxID=2921768 RepID=UPI0020298500|nr:hypothetical protein [Caballeronia sp. ATUFL_F1_KS4A]